MPEPSLSCPPALPASALCRKIDAGSLPFERSDQIPPPPDHRLVGQDRAANAIQFGLGMSGPGYNLFCMGPEGTGKASLIRRLVQAAARDKAPAEDLAYIHNFDDPGRPRALRLPAGTAPRLARALEVLANDLRHTLPAALDSDETRRRREALAAENRQKREAVLESLQQQAREQGIALMRTPAGLALSPLRDGAPLSAEDFSALPDSEQQRLRELMERLQLDLEQSMLKIPPLEREHRQQLVSLVREIAAAEVDRLIAALLASCPVAERARAHLGAIRQDVLEHVALYLPGNTPESGEPLADPSLSATGPEDSSAPPASPSLPQDAISATLRRYLLNVLVTRAADSGAPVIEEMHPTQPNLAGRIDHRQHLGALVTDFHLIRPGALHQANGGFLILDARKLLGQPFAWADLKRALRSARIKIEAPGSAWGVWSTQTLEPEAVPLDLKVILLGEPALFYLLSEEDPDFAELFKSVADFDTRMAWTKPHLDELALALAAIARDHGLHPFTGAAIARVIEYGSRLQEDQEKLSTHMGSLLDLMREADYIARRSDIDPSTPTVIAAHVQAALEDRRHRNDRIPQAMREEIERHTLHIETSGATIGQINGLAVLQIGQQSFGKPSRITARVRLGQGELVHIEREADLSGPLHSKGVMILTSFLASRFAENDRFPLHATLVFEQSYGMIEGDSASSTEVYALLSAIANQPLRQDLAVTGSVDQFGRVQAIGGVNEKIEGFFDLCAARGLTGSQGVLIPSTNVPHLMLREDVVEACANGKFHIYPVSRIDEGIELLTGLSAGERQADGDWPLGSLNRMVASRLSAWARRLRELESGGDSRRRDK